VIWTLIALVAMTTVAIKAFGPITVGGRELPPWSAKVIASMAPALLAALVVTAALADGQEWAIGPDTAGVSVAGVALWFGVPVQAAVFIAAAVTAVLRAL
jgi:branched-subunit amino acid transport protein